MTDLDVVSRVVEKRLQEMATKQLAATIKAVNKKGLMNTSWDDIDKEGGHIDFKVIAQALAQWFLECVPKKRTFIMW